MQRIRLISWGLVAVAVIAIGAFLLVEQPWSTGSDKRVGTAGKVETVKRGPVAAFVLKDPSGKTVRATDFRGKWLMVYFGFTFCPDVCPTSLAAMSKVLDGLGDDAKMIQPILISVDPERDTPEKMGKYTGAFDKRILGLVGTMEQTRAAAKAFGAYFKKRKTGKGEQNYLVDHSSFFHLMGPDGRFRAVYGSNERTETIVKSIKNELNKRSSGQ